MWEPLGNSHSSALTQGPENGSVTIWFLTMHHLESLKKLFIKKMGRKKCTEVSVLTRKQPFCGHLGRGVPCEMNLCLNGMSIENKYANVHGICATVNSEESLHVCVFSHLDPSFLKSYQATSQK